MMRHKFTALILAVSSVVALSGCGAMGQFFPDFDGSSGGATPGVTMARDSGMMSAPNADMLVSCRGHVLVPAMGMTFVRFGGQPPSRGQFLREESLTAPYRVLPPGAMATMDNVPSRLNIDLDGNSRVVGIRCG